MTIVKIETGKMIAASAEAISASSTELEAEDVQFSRGASGSFWDDDEEF